MQPKDTGMLVFYLEKERIDHYVSCHTLVLQMIPGYPSLLNNERFL